ncbi:MAG: hypothetical protein QOG06_1240 [Gaiellaceae bacterium]|jgi:hypothetical protein|nr:hypothetical protein [Gaiellaceae bacterium]
MRARRALAVGAALGSTAGAVLLRRRSGRRRDRAELYFDDGSLVTVAQGSAEAERLLVHARELLAAARG